MTTTLLSAAALAVLPSYAYAHPPAPSQPELESSDQGGLLFRVDSLIPDGYWGVWSHDPFTDQDAYTKTDLSLTYFAPNHGTSVFRREISRIRTRSLQPERAVFQALQRPISTPLVPVGSSYTRHSIMSARRRAYDEGA